MSDNRRRVSEKETRRRRREQRIREERRRKRRRKAILLRVIVGVVLVLMVGGIVFGVRSCSGKRQEQLQKEKAQQEEQARLQEELQVKSKDAAGQADALAAGYDYDGAIALIESVEGYDQNANMTSRITAYKKDKSSLVAFDVNQVEHFSFRLLIADAALAAASQNQNVLAANQQTMTVEAFNQKLQQMYDEGYVLVSIRDLVKETKAEDGSTTFEKGEIMLPEGKKAFVLSQMDVSYPFVLAAAGYGSRMVVDGDGNLKVEAKLSDGNTVSGDYDVVPCLETFIAEHPDFAYHQARGILGITGYNGVLGYRTDADLAKSESEGNSYAAFGTYDTGLETENSKVVIQTLKDKGWELASNGYSGESYASTMDRVQADAAKWNERVGSLIGGTDILLFPQGVDINSWTDYTQENQRYAYLSSLGFRYFCTLDSTNPYWVQIRSGYVRQAAKAMVTDQSVQPPDEGQDSGQ